MLTLVLALGLCDIILTRLGQRNLAVYYIFNAGLFLSITLLYGNLKPLARRNLNIVGVLFFIGIIVLALLRLLQFGQAA